MKVYFIRFVLDGVRLDVAYCLNHDFVRRLLRQFGPENWTLYKGKHLLAFGMPGIPCVYYGSEWGAKGKKLQRCGIETVLCGTGKECTY